jgi:signal transduction histidine kinase
MFTYRLEYRHATPIRIAGLALVVWTVFSSSHAPGGSGRSLVTSLTLAGASVGWVLWTIWPRGERLGMTAPYVMAAAGGVLIGACPDSAASAFVFIGVAAAGVRKPLPEAIGVLVVGVVALGISTLVYDNGGLGFLAFSLGFAAALFGAANARGSLLRAEQAELLLAESQRSHEEQVRVARLEEQARIAREIHDVLAHALAGLSIQLEATASLIEHGAEREAILTRVHRAHELAREGLRETRHAVGALRGDTVSVAERLEALADEYRAGGQGSATLSIRGDVGRLEGSVAEAVSRVVQESLTNVRKHARGADVSITLDAGAASGDDVVLVVADQNAHPEPAASGAAEPLAETGGGFGLRGMRERAELLGGTLTAGANGSGWRVELRLPTPAKDSQ